MDLHRKYRPKTLEDVVGQSHIIPSLQKALKNKMSHTFLAIGPTGVGKTTIARIIAKMVGAADHAIFEHNASADNGIDAAREISKMARSGVLGSDSRVFILDEVDGYSKAAWSALRKPLEEPPENCYFILCTETGDKVLPNIKGRCIELNLKPVQPQAILVVLAAIKSKEKFAVSDKVLSLISESSNGSVRRAITLLAKCSDIQKVEQAKEIIGSAIADGDDPNNPVILLCRKLLSSPASGVLFDQCRKHLKEIKEQGISAETARCILTAYFEQCMLNMPMVQATKCLSILSNFTTPYYAMPGIAAFAVSLANYCLDSD